MSSSLFCWWLSGSWCASREQSVFAHHHDVGADWNASPVSNVLSSQLFSKGAGIPRWVNTQGDDCPVTYRSGDSETCPDVMVSPTQCVYPQAGSPHAIISLHMRCEKGHAYPRLQPQVTVQFEAKPEEMMPRSTWDPIHSRILEMIKIDRRDLEEGSLREGTSECQSRMDGIWGVFHNALADHISDHAQVTSKQGVTLPRYRMGRSQLESHLAHMRRMHRPTVLKNHMSSNKKSRQTNAEACTHRNIHRLISLAQNQGERQCGA